MFKVFDVLFSFIAITRISKKWLVYSFQKILNMEKNKWQKCLMLLKQWYAANAFEKQETLVFRGKGRYMMSLKVGVKTYCYETTVCFQGEGGGGGGV